MTTLVYDGDCGFCTTCVQAMERLRIRADAVIPWQQADLDGLGLTAQECTESVQWIGEDGSHRRGHEAIAALLVANRRWKPVGRLLTAPGISWAAAKVYAWVAAHRTRLPGGTPACAVPPAE
ncbi:MAG: thiol-disulfide oxidoreductase DCC family protein [Mycobacteriales bacterium]